MCEVMRLSPTLRCCHSMWLVTEKNHLNPHSLSEIYGCLHAHKFLALVFHWKVASMPRDMTLPVRAVALMLCCGMWSHQHV